MTDGERILWRAYKYLFFPHSSESDETAQVLIGAVYACRQGASL